VLVVLSGGLFSYPHPLAAAEFPYPFVARFSISAQGTKIGEAEWSVKPLAPGLYAYESRTTTAGIVALFRKEEVVERSEWRLDEGYLRPLEYSYRRVGGEKDRSVTVLFDWEKKLAHNTAKGHTWWMPVPLGTLDKLSYVLVLMGDLAAEKKVLQYQIADGGRLKLYRLRIEENERLETALGPLETVRIRRLRDSDKRETVLWCAKNLGYLPVKIEHREPDGTLLIRIVAVEGLGL
jgi:hypothetical protein